MSVPDNLFLWSLILPLAIHLKPKEGTNELSKADFVLAVDLRVGGWVYGWVLVGINVISMSLYICIFISSH